MTSRMTSRYSDSTDKTFYRLRLLHPSREVQVGPSAFRAFACEECTACCDPTYTRDYLPQEGLAPQGDGSFQPRQVRSVTVLTYDPQGPCQYLVQGRCSLWPDPPLECFAAPQVQIYPRRGVTIIMGRIYTRYWRWPEGQRPRCRFEERFSRETQQHLIRALERYYIWAEAFHLETSIPKILEVVRGIDRLPTTVITIPGEGGKVLEP